MIASPARQGQVPSSSLLLLIVATSLWGGSSAILSTVDGQPVGVAGLVLLCGALPLALLAAARGDLPRSELSKHLRTLLPFGLLEATNISLYISALQTGPLALVVALHLAAPIILLLHACATGRRRFRWREAVELTLIVIGVALVASARDRGGGDAVIGALLAIGSAAALAMLINKVALSAPGLNPDAAAAGQLAIAGACTAPLLLVPGGLPSDFGGTALAGILLLGPGFALYWRALRELSAPAAGVVGLNEAIVASLLGAAFLAESLSAGLLGGSCLILLAIGAELRVQPSRTAA